MSIIKWSPFFPSLDEFEDQFLIPALDVYQDEDHVVVEAPLAGVDPEKVDISIENDVLTIKGENEKKSEVEEKNYYRKEVRHGSFFRSVQLPARVEGEKAEATYDKGILIVKIPKIGEVKSKNIKIKVK